MFPMPILERSWVDIVQAGRAVSSCGVGPTPVCFVVPRCPAGEGTSVGAAAPYAMEVHGWVESGLSDPGLVANLC